MKKNSIIDSAVKKASNELIKKFDDLIIEGLKRKGFEFNNKSDLIDFTIQNVRCEDNVDLQEKIYYVNDIPFFLHVYKIDFNPTITEPFVFTASYGSYRFL